MRDAIIAPTGLALNITPTRRGDISFFSAKGGKKGYNNDIANAQKT